MKQVLAAIHIKPTRVNTSRFICLVTLSIAVHGQVLDITNVPRDIEQVWERPLTKTSFTSIFQATIGSENVAHSVAIVIGLSDYTNYWPPLEAPWYDATRVTNFLGNSGFDYIVTLTNKKASKENIRHYMEDVLPGKISPGDRFLFYFSGHGTQRTLFNAVRGYLPMLESQRDNWSSMIGMDEISQWSENVKQARHSLFILDSCFSGLAGQQTKGAPYVKVYVDDLLKPGHFLMTAGAAGQESYASLKQWGGSLFTDAFLRGSAGDADSGTPDFPPDGIISLTKLYDYIRRRISSERTRVPSVVQTPLLSDLTPTSTGEFFFLADPKSVHAKFSNPSPASQPPEAKGAGYVLHPDLPPAETIAAKVDRVFGHGFSDFPAWQFGQTLEKLGNYTWDQLPRAPEFGRNDVRYLILNIKQAGTSLKDEGCISPTSYFVFFFESHKLFRISIRFFDEGACPSHSTWLTHFANSVGATIVPTESLRWFVAEGKTVDLLGGSTKDGTFIDLVSSKSAALMTAPEWLTWIKGL